MSDADTFHKVVKRAGTLTELAHSLGESPQVVNHWRHRGFPANRCRAIEELTGVSVKELRPNDWADYWPELRARPLKRSR